MGRVEPVSKLTRLMLWATPFLLAALVLGEVMWGRRLRSDNEDAPFPAVSPLALVAAYLWWWYTGAFLVDVVGWHWFEAISGRETLRRICVEAPWLIVAREVVTALGLVGLVGLSGRYPEGRLGLGELPAGRERWQETVMLVAVSALLAFVTLELLMTSPANQSGAPLRSGPLWLQAWSMLIAAPFIEEYLDRGILFSTLRQRLPLWGSVGVSALVFSAGHGWSDGGTFLVRFFLGVLLAVGYERTRSIWVPVGMHVAWNTIMSGLLYG